LQPIEISPRSIAWMHLSSPVRLASTLTFSQHACATSSCTAPPLSPRARPKGPRRLRRWRSRHRRRRHAATRFPSSVKLTERLEQLPDKGTRSANAAASDERPTHSENPPAKCLHSETPAAGNHIDGIGLTSNLPTRHATTGAAMQEGSRRRPRSGVTTLRVVDKAKRRRPSAPRPCRLTHLWLVETRLRVSPERLPASPKGTNGSSRTTVLRHP
jgi:hypothetical protein